MNHISFSGKKKCDVMDKSGFGGFQDNSIYLTAL